LCFPLPPPSPKSPVWHFICAPEPSHRRKTLARRNQNDKKRQTAAANAPCPPHFFGSLKIFSEYFFIFIHSLIYFLAKLAPQKLNTLQAKILAETNPQHRTARYSFT
jgi:hypothetical protein